MQWGRYLWEGMRLRVSGALLILLWKYDDLAVWTSAEKDESKTDTYSGLMDILICTIFSLLPWDWSDSHEEHRITRDEKWVGKGRKEDTTEERWEGERERRYLKCVLSFVWCPVLNVDVELRVYSCLPCVTPWMFIKRPSFVILHRLLVPSLLHSSYPGSK